MGNMLAKCGAIYTWHWAHEKGASCDQWSEPESEWHRSWKRPFPADWIEVVLTDNGVRHIADIKTDKGVVIELQNSPIASDVVLRREAFYGERMLWVINAYPVRENLELNPYETEWPEMRLGDRIIDYHTKKVIYDEENLKNMFSFRWKRMREAWSSADRPIFLDFGTDEIYRMKIRRFNNGVLRKYDRDKFILKYGGLPNLMSPPITTQGPKHVDYLPPLWH
ncbi:MAG: hypothetical protein IPN44_07870 [Flavobacteriales bacterium]|nr:hypothetical protein [Flavobacteriales bacterium]